MNERNGSVRVRFAPSPTGYLHIGSLRAALFNWLFARHHGGTFLLRIEDTDRERSQDAFTQAIFQTLAWVNLEPDEPAVIQSTRTAAHTELIERLLQEGKAYKCYCTPDALAARHSLEAFIQYDGLCRNRPASQVPEGNPPYVVRFKISEGCHSVSFDDLIRGTVTFDADQLDDFIIQRSDGSPIYNFVVVADDHAMGITHVIRGEDHISNSPKQILLYQALGFPVPFFAHLPLILGPSGDRLSKRDAATDARDYRKAGYLPEALLNYLVRLGWSCGDQEIFSRDELIKLFTLDGVGKKGSIFDVEKLRWVNSVYLKKMSAADLISYITTDLDPDFEQQLGCGDLLAPALELYKERVHTIQELLQEVRTVCAGPTDYSEADLDRWTNPQTCGYLEKICQVLQEQTSFNSDSIASAIKQLSKECGVKIVQLAQPIRIALIGHSDGPGAFALVALLGRQESISRMQRLQNRLANGQA